MAIHRDEGQSGKTLDRPALLKHLRESQKATHQGS